MRRPTVTRVQSHIDPNLALLAFVLLALAAMALLYFSTRRLATVVVNGWPTTIWTSQATVRTALLEAGFTWNAEDVFQPGLDQPIPGDGKIVVRTAAPVKIEADGNVLSRRTQATTVSAVLKENGIALKPSDRVFLNGKPIEPQVPLPRSGAAGRTAAPAVGPDPSRITVERAVPIQVDDNGLVSTIYTTSSTLGEALNDSGVLVYLGDYVSPDLGTRVTAGESVFIRRSRAATITVDGRTVKTRTRADNVAGLLSQEGIELAGKDYTDPVPTTPVIDGLQINITRVREVYITETQYLTYETKWVANPDVEIDKVLLAQNGARGVKNRLYKSVYENGKLISRALDREWVASPPQNKIWNYGTKIVLRDLKLPDGTVVKYWRKIRMFATAYSAATSGKLKGNPEYGITYMGLTAGKGIVAVDPRVVNLMSNLYVPGYGVAVAGDTGGGILGKRIDLGYPEDALESWYQWVDVYLLAPAPPGRLINYRLPDYPSGKP